MIFDIAFDTFLSSLNFSFYFLYVCISYAEDDQQIPAKNKLKDIKS